MDNYLEHATETNYLPSKVSYLAGAAHERGIVLKKTNDGIQIKAWNGMRKTLAGLFDTLNGEKLAQDQLARRRQVKNVFTLKNDFQKILPDIPNTSKKQQVVRYTRDLKYYILRELFTKDYKKVSEEIGDAKRVKAAHLRLEMRTAPVLNKLKSGSVDRGPLSVRAGNIQLGKHSLAEREEYRKIEYVHYAVE